MKKRTWVWGGVAIVALGMIALMTHNSWRPEGAAAQSKTAAVRVVPVEITAAVKKPAPVMIEALGTVSPIETVALRPRVDSEIIQVHFADGATVKQGDVLFTLDSRSIEAQIKQVEGNIARDKAQIEGAERDVRRYTELVEKNATPVINLDNARTQADTFRANLIADQGALDNLKVQLSYCTIRAPISGRIGAANVKAGNIARTGDATPIAVINQITPVYVVFSVPQRVLSQVQETLGAGTPKVEAAIAGNSKRASGRLSMIDNNVDVNTGMVGMRAVMDNKDQLLWPGALVNVQLTLKVEEAVNVPTAAVQTGQSGNYVFVVKDNIASLRPVKVARITEVEAVIEQGLEPGETVVTYGQLLLNNGTKVAPRDVKVGS
ncbi:MAG TPA: efflux RND transporter periplasmic adaptor subunit [Xanthobacteraceae bacterium]|jgi:RND family efflux transporter MFP subunit|nr:efflux RND transporter periplasmic adaptor subunit [Xanthobacteraceae bacterium]